MPWMYVPNRPSNRRRNRNGNGYRAGNGYDNNPYAGHDYFDQDPNLVDTFDDYGDPEDTGYPPPRPGRRRKRNNRGNRNALGLYDEDGAPVNLVIQTPSDMLPPIRPADTSDSFAPVRRRARF